MIKELTALCGVSGNEGEVADFIKSQISGFEVTQDILGNIIAVKRGGNKKVMLCAHMDEVGFVVSGITPDGFIKFRTVGGFDERLLPGLSVLVGDKKYGIPDDAPEIALWSHQLKFYHPRTGEAMEFTLPPPTDWPWDLFPEL